MVKRFRKPEVSYPTDIVFAASAYADRVNNGYVKFVDYSQGSPVTNRQLMEQALADNNLITDIDREAGASVRKYYHTLTFKVLKGIRLNEFEHNAMLLATKEEVTGNYGIAVIACLPSSYRRAVERDQADSKVAFARGGFVGNVGDKVVANVEVTKCVYSQQWGVFFVTGITDKDQPVFFANKEKFDVGTTMIIKGAVKAHRDNSTQLNRVKVL